MIRKCTALLAAALMLISLLGGCAQPAATPAPAAEAPAAEAPAAEAPAAEQPATAEPVTLNILWATENNWPGFEDFLAKYEAETGNTVDVQYYPSTEYSTIITTKMMAGEGPDIFRTDAINLEAMWPQEWFADLTNEEWTSRLSEGGKTNLSWTNGKIVQAPTQPLGPYGLAYNKDTLEASGVTELPTNWTEFLAACEKVKAAGFTPFNVQLASGHEFGMTIVQQVGFLGCNKIYGQAEFIEMLKKIAKNELKMADIPEFVQVMDQFWELKELGYINEDFLSTTMEMTSARLGAGDCAFTSGGEWMLPALIADYPDANIGLMPVPVGDNQGVILVSGGVGMAVNANSTKLDAAKEFVSMWCSKEWMDDYVALNPGTTWFSDVHSDGNKFTADTTAWLEKGQTASSFNPYLGAIYPEMESRSLFLEFMTGDLSSVEYMKAVDAAAEIIAVGNGVEGW